jgi:hypothetical protein
MLTRHRYNLMQSRPSGPYEVLAAIPDYVPTNEVEARAVEASKHDESYRLLKQRQRAAREKAQLRLALTASQEAEHDGQSMWHRGKLTSRASILCVFEHLPLSQGLLTSVIYLLKREWSMAFAKKHVHESRQFRTHCVRAQIVQTREVETVSLGTIVGHPNQESCIRMAQK